MVYDMRVLFVPMIALPHYWPMVPLAWACRAAGHDVRVAGQPDVIDSVLKSGMTPVRVGRDYDVAGHLARAKAELIQELQKHESETKVAGADGPPAPIQHRLKAQGDLPPALQQRMVELKAGPTAGLTDAVADDLVSLARQWRPHIIVTDPLLYYAATLAAAASGAVLVRHLWGPDYATHVGSWGIGTAGAVTDREQWPESLLRIYDRFGVDVRSNFFDMTLDPGPASLQLPGVQNAVSYGCMPYNGPAELPGWLLKPPEAPRICVTLGSSRRAVMGREGFIVPEILSGLADLDAEIVVAVKSEDRELITNPPANVRIAEWLPLSLVLPTCSAILHQAGGGTTLTSTYCGVPQVLVPQMLDERFTAECVESSGAAVILDPTQAKNFAEFGDTAARTLRGLLEDGKAIQAARGLQKELESQPTPAEIVPKLESLLA
jgi:UDP:flavonoid glycosyltransferase YjiC (YdhE family)